MIKKSWEAFFKKLDKIKFEDFDLIVAIAEGGIIPAAFIQQKLKIPMKIIRINFRDNTNNPKFEEAKLLEKEPCKFQGKRILIIDDVSRTGNTLNKAKKYLQGNALKTCLINGDGDYSFYKSKYCIKMPWKR